MKYPIVNITGDKWNDWGDVICYILDEPNYYSHKKKIIEKYYINHEFCDSNGQIFIVKRLNPITGLWKSLLSALPGTTKGFIEFTPTTKIMDLESFKSFMIKKVNEIDDHKSTLQWIEIIYNAKFFEEILNLNVEVLNYNEENIHRT